ncbi:MAG: NADH-quinone oxidoreductase subunit N [Opitutia bacterium]|jgi:NADH-quinone oxidoreductase subunit N
MNPALAALDAFKSAAPQAGDWASILPEILVAGLGVFALLQALVLPADGRWLIPTVARAGLLVAGFLAYHAGESVGARFGGLLLQDASTQLWRQLFLLCALLTSLVGARFFRQRGADEAEFHHILLLVTASLMILAQSSHVVTFFVALETATVGLYVLCGFLRRSAASLEAGVRYLVAGGLSSALLLMGFVLLHGLAGMHLPKGTDPLHFASIAAALLGHGGEPLALVGAALVLAGLGFKLGAFPFHGWVPDVYQGAPTPVTALLATASKSAGVVGLILVVSGPLAPIAAKLTPVLAVLAGGSLLAGNLAALGSSDTKRALALSGVSHAGFLLAGIAGLVSLRSQEGVFGAADIALPVVLAYLLAYVLGTFATMGALAALPAESDERRPLVALRGLIRRSPSLAAGLTLGIGSLAGIPPSIGFFAKLLILWVLVSAEAWVLLGLAVVSVAVSIHYYFSIIREATVRNAPDGETPPEIPLLARALPLGLGILTVLLGLGSLIKAALG